MSSTSYNDLGQIKQINLGNGLKTTFDYWGIDHETGSYGRLWEIKTLPQADGSGAPAGNVLASSQSIDEASLPSAWTEVTFTFTSGYALTAGTKYALILHATVSGLYAKVDKNGVYPRGQECFSSDNVNWSMSNSTWDAWFEDDGTGTTTGFIYDGDGNRFKKTEGGSGHALY